MIGNDIVDLGDGETRLEACHSRFDQRVVAPEEFELLAAAPQRERMRWILWSAKEAAYKAARRACANTVFSPSRFVVQLNQALHGVVRHGSRRWDVRIQLDGDCVHAVACDEKFHSDSIWGARQLIGEGDGEPSEEVRCFAKTEVASRLGLPVDQLRIERSGRIPQLLFAGSAPFADLSLSHHGAYVGFACRMGRERAGGTQLPDQAACVRVRGGVGPMCILPATGARLHPAD